MLERHSEKTQFRTPKKKPSPHQVRKERRKAREKVPSPADLNKNFDKVDQASWESFPASDSPGW